MLRSAGLVCRHWAPRNGAYVLDGKEAEGGSGGGADDGAEASLGAADGKRQFFGVGGIASCFREAGVVMGVVATADTESGGAESGESGSGLTVTMVVHLTALMYRGRRVVLVLSETARRRAAEAAAATGEAGAVATQEM